MPTKFERNLAQRPVAHGSIGGGAARSQIDVWITRIPSAGAWARVGRDRLCLSAGELEICSVFHREQDRVRAAISRVLLRTTLSRYAPIPPEDWSFVLGQQGKPAVANPGAQSLQFNVSHTGAFAACAVTLDGEIGIDIEDSTREVELLGLARRVFAPDELADFEALAPQARRRRFFELWTLKEAYLKARGLGFQLDPRQVAFALDGTGNLRARFEPAARESAGSWWFSLLGIEPAHTLALAARTGGRRPDVRTFHLEPGELEPWQLRPAVRAQSGHP